MNNHIKGAILAFIGAVMFAGKAVIIKWIYMHYDGLSALPLLALRMIFSLPFYIVVLWFSSSGITYQLSKKDYYYIVGLGIIGYYLASYFDFKGLEYITATLERLILFIYPTLVVLISALFLRKKITPIQVVAIVITYVGIGITFVPELELDHQNNVIAGSIFIFLSALTYAVYLIGSGELVRKIGSQRLTSLVLIVSCITVLIHYYVEDGRTLLGFDMMVYVLCLIMAIFCTVIPTFMVAEGIKLIGAGNAAIISTVGPLATIIMATQILGEPFNLWHAAGTVLILFGVFWVSKK
ncbi:MAG: EamA family transporter [Saprospiraceae bacterium]|jgi:drug/metabolite transporter (DMT)-like permease|nr:EamA family transporter [Saprospiraceae bacterium]